MTWDSRSAEGEDTLAYSTLEEAVAGDSSWHEFILRAEGLPFLFLSIDAGGSSVDYELYEGATASAVQRSDSRSEVVPSSSVSGGSGATISQHVRGGAVLVRVKSSADFELDAHLK